MKSWPLAFFAAFTLFFSAVSVANDALDSGVQWTLIYSQDKDGNALEGDKSSLLNAIRNGHEIWVYWQSSRVEHLTDIHFVTIFEGEVFAQPNRIVGQRPSIENDIPTITLSPEGNEWTTIISTTGQFPYPVKWFVRD